MTWLTPACFVTHANHTVCLHCDATRPVIPQPASGMLVMLPKAKSESTSFELLFPPDHTLPSSTAVSYCTRCPSQQWVWKAIFLIHHPNDLMKMSNWCYGNTPVEFCLVCLAKITMCSCKVLFKSSSTPNHALFHSRFPTACL